MGNTCTGALSQKHDWERPVRLGCSAGDDKAWQTCLNLVTASGSVCELRRHSSDVEL
jgi:hypothetical protein